MTPEQNLEYLRRWEKRWTALLQKLQEERRQFLERIKPMYERYLERWVSGLSEQRPWSMRVMMKASIKLKNRIDKAGYIHRKVFEALYKEYMRKDEFGYYYHNKQKTA